MYEPKILIIDNLVSYTPDDAQFNEQGLYLLDTAAEIPQQLCVSNVAKQFSGYCPKDREVLFLAGTSDSYKALQAVLAEYPSLETVVLARPLGRADDLASWDNITEKLYAEGTPVHVVAGVELPVQPGVFVSAEEYTRAVLAVVTDFAPVRARFVTLCCAPALFPFAYDMPSNIVGLVGAVFASLEYSQPLTDAPKQILQDFKLPKGWQDYHARFLASAGFVTLRDGWDNDAVSFAGDLYGTFAMPNTDHASVHTVKIIHRIMRDAYQAACVCAKLDEVADAVATRLAKVRVVHGDAHSPVVCAVSEVSADACVLDVSNLPYRYSTQVRVPLKGLVNLTRKDEPSYLWPVADLEALWSDFPHKRVTNLTSTDVVFTTKHGYITFRVPKAGEKFKLSTPWLTVTLPMVDLSAVGVAVHKLASQPLGYIGVSPTEEDF